METIENLKAKAEMSTSYYLATKEAFEAGIASIEAWELAHSAYMLNNGTYLLHLRKIEENA
jgi:hypothetical protein